MEWITRRTETNVHYLKRGMVGSFISSLIGTMTFQISKLPDDSILSIFFSFFTWFSDAQHKEDLDVEINDEVMILYYNGLFVCKSNIMSCPILNSEVRVVAGCGCHQGRFMAQPSHLLQQCKQFTFSFCNLNFV